MDKDRITSVDLFAELPDEQVEKLAGTANEWSASKGDTLIQREDSAFQLFAIEDGSVEVCKEQEKLATVGKGEVVGEIGVAKRGVRKASMEVAEDAKGFFLTNSQWRCCAARPMASRTACRRSWRSAASESCAAPAGRAGAAATSPRRARA